MPNRVSRLKNALRYGISAAAATIGLGDITVKPAGFSVSSKRGKPRSPYRYIIRHEVDGPYYQQVGVAKDGRPLMQVRRYHRFLHATKGWRVYTHGLPGVGRGAHVGVSHPNR